MRRAAPRRRRRLPECGTELGDADEAASATASRAAVAWPVATATDAALRADGVSKRYGERVALRDVTFAAAPRRAASRSSGPTAPARRRCCRSSPASCAPTPGSVDAAARARSAGSRSSRRSTRSSRWRRTCACSRGWRRWPTWRPPSRGCSSRPASPTAPATRSAGCRAATASASTSRSACSPTRRCCCSTSRRPSLDPRQRERLWEFVGGLAARGTAVVFSTHDVGEAERYADRVLVLADGELLFTGTPRELERAPAATARRDFEAAFVRFLHERGH